MTTLTRNMTFAACALTMGVFFGTSSDAQLVCSGEPQSYKLKIRVVQDRPVEVLHKGENADDFHVCPGDDIEWKLQGSAKKFYLNFIDGAPFTGDSEQHSKNGKISVTVDGANGGEVLPYDLALFVGAPIDARIIVE